jgi:hypothetical protein
MPHPGTSRPAYRHYKPKTLAVVRIEEKDHDLGAYGSDASLKRYHRLASTRRLSPRASRQRATASSGLSPSTPDSARPE